ncbi:MAG: ribonuclease HII [Candidatus Colwellbacteria bacterium]|nr:ribonuclease HII [Candidatus Colwellbacteria bacterium]
MRKIMYIVGIDEAGRGSLAGPIVVAAVSIPKGFYPRSGALPRLRDSKKLNPSQRSFWFRYIKAHPKITYSTARIYPRKIEKLNIANCANLAAHRCYSKIAGFINETSAKKADYSDFTVFLDGSLYLGSKKSQPSFAKTVTRGDEKFVVIKLASIVAKVTRDRYMIALHKKEPLYQFNLHKGYGTHLHQKLIQKHGPAEVHRLTYLKEYRKLLKV